MNPTASCGVRKQVEEYILCHSIHMKFKNLQNGSLATEVNSVYPGVIVTEMVTRELRGMNPEVTCVKLC